MLLLKEKKNVTSTPPKRCWHIFLHMSFHCYTPIIDKRDSTTDDIRGGSLFITATPSAQEYKMFTCLGNHKLLKTAATIQIGTTLQQHACVVKP